MDNTNEGPVEVEEAKKKSTWSKIGSTAADVWEFLDGKKTVIGGIMVWASSTIPMPPLYQGILYWGGVLIGGTGVVHKATKGDLGANIEKAGRIAIKPLPTSIQNKLVV